MNEDLLKRCVICPHECKVNRINGEVGRCNAGKNVKIALAKLHYYEEPCISGKEGSGAIFFTGCNLKCKYCQNYKVSQELLGNEITIEELANEFIKLQNQNANNINLVTAVSYVPQIIEAIKIAREKGLNIPIIYNSSGYEKVETIKMLDGYVDVYLPDFKYYYDDLGFSLSGIKDYPEVAKEAIKEMYNQVGKPRFDKKGRITRGVIIRHLVLPNHIDNSKLVLKWIKENMPKDILVSVMAQYFPTYNASKTNDINRKLTEEEFSKIESFVFDLDLDGYMQDLEDDEEQYVPQFEEK